MRTQAAGPSNGALPIIRAAEAPPTQMQSGAFLPSHTSVVATMCTSRLKPSTKPGRMGRSIMRAVSVPFSDGTRLTLEVAAGDAPDGTSSP